MQHPTLLKKLLGEHATKVKAHVSPYLEPVGQVSSTTTTAAPQTSIRAEGSLRAVLNAEQQYESSRILTHPVEPTAPQCDTATTAYRMAIFNLPHDIRVSLYLAHRGVRSITARSEPRSVSTSNTTSASCPPTALSSSQILLPRTPFILTVTLLSVTTVLSLIALSLLLSRQFSRARQLERAKTWGRQSKFYEIRGKRISLMRKEVDDSFSRQYSGVLATVPENPEMGSDSPVEMCERDARVWEMGGGGGGTVKYGKVTGTKREEKKEDEARVGSLFFCRDLGVWMPKR